MSTTSKRSRPVPYDPQWAEEDEAMDQRERARNQALDIARDALSDNANAREQIGWRIADEMRASAYRRALAALMPATRETAGVIADIAMRAIADSQPS